jgi:hypothetical protein
MLISNSEIPELPGVYVLIHRATMTCFVGATGCLRQRRTVWRSIMSRGEASKRRRGFPDHPVEQWEFKIIEAGEHLTTEQLAEITCRTIERAQRQGFIVVNRAARPPQPQQERQSYDWRAHALGLMPVPILDEAGRPVTYAEAAELMGRTVETVKEAAKRVRSRSEAAGAPVEAIGLDQLRAVMRRPRRR